MNPPQQARRPLLLCDNVFYPRLGDDGTRLYGKADRATASAGIFTVWLIFYVVWLGLGHGVDVLIVELLFGVLPGCCRGCCALFIQDWLRLEILRWLQYGYHAAETQLDGDFAHGYSAGCGPVCPLEGKGWRCLLGEVG